MTTSLQTMRKEVPRSCKSPLPATLREEDLRGPSASIGLAPMARRTQVGFGPGVSRVSSVPGVARDATRS